MKVQINGQPKEIPSDLTIDGLIAHEQIKQPLMVTVEYNGDILERETFATTNVSEGDAIEFLYFMGGGC